MAFYSENLPRLFSEKITAVFAVSDHYALEFMRFLQGQGIRVPEDVQIIGFDDTLASRESVPALTTIHQDAALRARTAIRRLEALRDGPPLRCRYFTKGSFSCQVSPAYFAAPFRKKIAAPPPGVVYWVQTVLFFQTIHLKFTAFSNSCIKIKLYIDI